MAIEKELDLTTWWISAVLNLIFTRLMFSTPVFNWPMLIPYLTHWIPPWLGRHVGLPKLVKFVSRDCHMKALLERICDLLLHGIEISLTKKPYRGKLMPIYMSKSLWSLYKVRVQLHVWQAGLSFQGWFSKLQNRTASNPQTTLRSKEWDEHMWILSTILTLHHGAIVTKY